MAAEPTICAWALRSAEERAYHDSEWGVPVTDDRKLFEFVVLEGAQAGLSWTTIIRKREGYRRALAGFDPAVVAEFDEADYERLLADPGIVRNRQKIRSHIANARAFLAVQREHGSFSRYIWSFVDHRPIQNRFRSLAELPAHTPLSDRIAKDLKSRGFSFMGSTIVYAHMQATGMVNDHLVDCPRHAEIQGLGGRDLGHCS